MRKMIALSVAASIATMALAESASASAPTIPGAALLQPNGPCVCVAPISTVVGQLLSATGGVVLQTSTSSSNAGSVNLPYGFHISDGIIIDASGRAVVNFGAACVGKTLPAPASLVVDTKVSNGQTFACLEPQNNVPLLFSPLHVAIGAAVGALIIEHESGPMTTGSPSHIK